MAMQIFVKTLTAELQVRKYFFFQCVYGCTGKTITLDVEANESIVSVYTTLSSFRESILPPFVTNTDSFLQWGTLSKM